MKSQIFTPLVVANIQYPTILSRSSILLLRDPFSIDSFFMDSMVLGLYRTTLREVMMASESDTNPRSILMPHKTTQKKSLSIKERSLFLIIYLGV